VEAADIEVEETQLTATVRAAGERTEFRFPFTESYNLANALAAIAIGIALDTAPAEMAERAGGITFSRLRGELVELGDEILVVNDCYNANPISMRAALDHLASIDRGGRRVAVLGEMAELGPDAASFHAEAGAHARELGVEVLIGVGEPAGAYAPDRQVSDAAEAGELLEELLEPGDTVLVKGSRAVGLEVVAERLRGSRPGPDGGGA
jgi:UDP-N-acetylmuramoyl-tripeptide--D-alanyl-D-alanine ligase